jgi:hypothetical protein
LFEDTNKGCALAEFACVYYNLRKFSKIQNYLLKVCEIDSNKYNKIYDILSKYELRNINVQGISTSQGYENSNKDLATCRAQTVLNWLKEYDPWKNIPSEISTMSGQSVKDNEKYDINGLSSKLNRAAKVKLTFALAKTNSVTESTEEPVNTTDTSTPQPKEYKEFVGFKFEKSDNTPYGKWDYYTKKSQVNYYEQIGGDNNTSNTTNNDVNGDKIVVKEEQINDVMKYLCQLQKNIDNDFLWKKICECDGIKFSETDTQIFEGDYIKYEDKYYICPRDMEFNDDNYWLKIENFERGKIYDIGDYVCYENEEYKTEVYEIQVAGSMEEWEPEKKYSNWI